MRKDVKILIQIANLRTNLGGNVLKYIVESLGIIYRVTN